MIMSFRETPNLYFIVSATSTSTASTNTSNGMNIHETPYFIVGMTSMKPIASHSYNEKMFDTYSKLALRPTKTSAIAFIHCDSTTI